LTKKFGFIDKAGIFESLGVKLDNGFYIILSALGTILLTIGGAYAGSYNFSTSWSACLGFLDCIVMLLKCPLLWLLLGAICLYLGAQGTYKDQNALNSQISEAKETKKALNSTQEELQDSKSKLIELQRELVKNWLKSASKHFSLDTHSRVTIYYEHQGEFYLLARYSQNPNFDSIHRQKFARNQGVISKAFDHGCHKEDQCPCPASTEANYSEYLNKEYGYESEKIKSLNMKSCRYLAKAIVDADNHIGVVVFESTQTEFFNKINDADVKKYCQDYQSQLAKFVRDILEYDKEIHMKSTPNAQVEDELTQMVGGKL
jgi:hypothetical protein